MLSRRHLQCWAAVTGVLLAASFALAGKPAPTPIIARTTDQNFLDNVVGKESSQTLFNLAIDVSGTGTHYRYQIGPAALIDPADSAAYSSPIAETTPLIADIAADPDGHFALCLQALQIDKKGNIKYIQTPPTIYSWVKSPPPQGTGTVVPLTALLRDESQVTLSMNGYGSAVAIAPGISATGWHYWNYSMFNGSSWSAATKIADALPDSAGVSQLLGGGYASFIPVLKTDGNGRFLFAWIEYDYNNGSIVNDFPDMRAVFYDGSDWGDVQLINQTYCLFNPTGMDVGKYGVVFNYDVAFSANGDAMVVWNYTDSGAGFDEGNFLITRLCKDGVWQPEVAHASTRARFPSIAADDNGNFMVAYVHGNTDGPTEGDIYYTLFNGTEWTEEARLNVHSNMIKASRVYAGDDGVVKLAGTGDKQFTAVYLSQTVNVDISDGLADNVNVYGRYFNGTDWETEFTLDNQDGDVSQAGGMLRLAMSASGSAIAMWGQYDGIGYTVYANRFDGAGNWDAMPTALSYNTYGDAKTHHGGIAMDAAGNALAAFYDTPYPQSTVVKVHYLAGYGWELTAVDDPDDWPFDRESLTVNPPASLAESRVAGQADGRAIIIHTPDDPDCVFPVDHFIALPLDIGLW